MDGRDVEILARLQSEPLASYEEIGDAVELSGTSVGNRLEAMRDQGILTGLRALPIAGLFDRYPTLLSFAPDDGSKALADEVIEVDSVVWVDRHQDGRVATLVYSATQVCEALPPLVDLVGREPELSLTLVERSLGPEDTLSQLDWRLIRELIDDPRASVAELAERTGLANNTVRRRRNRLWREDYLHVFPLVETAHAPGLIVFLMVVQVDDPGDRALIQRTLPSATPVRVHEDCGGRSGMTLVGHAGSVAELVEMEDRVGDTDGLRLVVRLHNMDRRFATERVKAWVDEEIDRWEEARP